MTLKHIDKLLRSPVQQSYATPTRSNMLYNVHAQYSGKTVHDHLQRAGHKLPQHRTQLHHLMPCYLMHTCTAQDWSQYCLLAHLQKLIHQHSRSNRGQVAGVGILRGQVPEAECC